MNKQIYIINNMFIVQSRVKVIILFYHNLNCIPQRTGAITYNEKVDFSLINICSNITGYIFLRLCI